MEQNELMNKNLIYSSTYDNAQNDQVKLLHMNYMIQDVHSYYQLKEKKKDNMMNSLISMIHEYQLKNYPFHSLIHYDVEMNLLYDVMNEK